MKAIKVSLTVKKNKLRNFNSTTLLREIIFLKLNSLTILSLKTLIPHTSYSLHRVQCWVMSKPQIKCMLNAALQIKRKNQDNKAYSI